MRLRMLSAALVAAALGACEAPTAGTGSGSVTGVSQAESDAQADQRRQRMSRYYGPRGGSR